MRPCNLHGNVPTRSCSYKEGQSRLLRASERAIARSRSYTGGFVCVALVHGTYECGEGEEKRYRSLLGPRLKKYRLEDTAGGRRACRFLVGQEQQIVTFHFARDTRVNSLPFPFEDDRGEGRRLSFLVWACSRFGVDSPSKEDAG